MPATSNVNVQHATLTYYALDKTELQSLITDITESASWRDGHFNIGNMVFFPCLGAMATFLLVAEGYRHPLKHEAVKVNRRQAMASPIAVMATATPVSEGVLTVITPSPGASPVSVTKQSQIVTTYDPQFTLCELPPIAYFSLTSMLSARPTTAPYRNYSVSIPPGNGSCTTVYSQTQTMVCDTTLSDLVTTYHVTNCAQEITFSSQYGYRLTTPTPASNLTGNATYPFLNATYSSALVTGTGTGSGIAAMITPAPAIETLTTYYLAPWQELTAATAPADVIKKVCQTLSNGTEECITQYEVWHTSLVTKTATSTFSLNVSTTVHGPSAVVIWETYVANVTEVMTTFSMLTTQEAEYETEWTTTHKNTATVSTAPTVYETRTVEEASST